MKFMKLGSKPDQFQTDGENIRYVATELATDAVVNVGDTKFYLHKFPLLSKSARLQKLVSCTGDETNDEINIHDIPGGPASFEICVKFCYGMTVTLNAYNVVAARCAAEYLEMYETVEKGNLIYKIQVFLTSSIFRSWKDSIIVLQTTKSLLPWSEELKIVSHSLDCIASKASIDPSKVEWSYTYNRKKLPSENDWNGVKKQTIVPHDWWVEDLCDLHIDLYKRVITTIKSKGKVSSNVIGEALQAYTIRKLPGFTKGIIQGSGNNNNNNNLAKYKYLIDTITTLLPFEKNTVSCSFLLRLLQANISFECGEIEKNEVMKRISYQLEDASVGDLLIRASSNEGTKYNFDLVHELVERFVTQEQNTEIEYDIVSDASKAKVARLIDGYLTEASRDPNLSLTKFMELSEMVSGFPRPSHDGLYRAIDMYLKEHQEITKSERKRICKLIDCRKLSAEACTHAVQNERLPMRLVVQILFFEQMRVVPGGSQGSSRSATTNTEDDWDALPTTEELKALKGELATLRLRDGGVQTNAEKVAENKVKGMVMSKLFSRLWSNKDRQSENSSSETSTSAEDTKSTPSRSRRQSLS